LPAFLLTLSGSATEGLSPVMRRNTYGSGRKANLPIKPSSRLVVSALISRPFGNGCGASVDFCAM